jgi:hypothetical protein
VRRNTFVTASLATFGLVLASFLVLGFGRLALPYRTARLLAAPTLLAAGALTVVLVAQACLVLLGVREFE